MPAMFQYRPLKASVSASTDSTSCGFSSRLSGRCSRRLSAQIIASGLSSDPSPGGFTTTIFLRERISTEIKFPPGYTVVFVGQFENQQRAQARLKIVVPLSLGLIFLLLYFAFDSVGRALLIMLHVPLALIGGIAALFFSGQYLSVPGSIGFIALLYIFVFKALARPVVTGKEEIMHSVGKVIDIHDHSIFVRIHGENWSAKSSDSLQVGDTVKVTGMDELTLIVENGLNNNRTRISARRFKHVL